MERPVTPIIDDRHLPDSDGRPDDSFQEMPQRNLLSSALWPHLRRLRPDDSFMIAGNSGIYFAMTDPPLDGCRDPAFYIVLDVPAMLDGRIRRSYVLWREMIPPMLVAEFVSSGSVDARDTTPRTGKFWIYERAIAAPYYAILDWTRETLEVFRLVGGRYRSMTPNDAGRFPVEPLAVELGTWRGRFRTLEGYWLRAWDPVSGRMIPTEAERLRALGIDPDAP